jgi:hypothetical protein
MMPARLLDITEALEHADTHRGGTLAEMNRAGPLLVVFLGESESSARQDMLTHLRAVRVGLEIEGARIAVVHEEMDGDAEALLRPFGLQNVARVWDPDRWLCRVFCLRKGGPLELVGPAVWKAGLEASGREALMPWVGERLQMPGIFVVYHGEIVHEYSHRDKGNLPNALWSVGRSLSSPS